VWILRQENQEGIMRRNNFRDLYARNRRKDDDTSTSERGGNTRKHYPKHGPKKTKRNYRKGKS
jgi:hypothetical protein